MIITRATALAGTLLISGAWFAGSHTRAIAETTSEAKTATQKDRIDDQAKKQKDHIDDQAASEKARVDNQAKVEKARADVRADEKKAAVDRGEKAASVPGDSGKDSGKKDGIGDEVSDTWITTKVKASFTGDKKLKGSEIHVDTDHKGVVVLSGYVKNDLVRAHAIAVARDTKGVHEVKDELRLKSER